MLRSLLYAHFSETFTGLSTIRSYGELNRFIKSNRYYIDLQNRSLFLVTTNERSLQSRFFMHYLFTGFGRWLGFRLDFMGSMLILIVSHAMNQEFFIRITVTSRSRYLQ